MTRAGFTSLVVVLWAVALAAPVEAKFPARVNATVPPGGSVQMGSPTLPNTATKATVDVAPKDGRKNPFDQLQLMFAGTKSKKARLLTCLYIHAVVTGITVDSEYPVDAKGNDPTLAFLLLAACAQMALQTPYTGPSASGTAASPCQQVKRAVPIEITKVGSQYHAEVDGSSSKTNRKLPLKITCRPKGDGVRLTARPRSPRKTLRQVAGRSLNLGVVNPPEAEETVPIRATFRPPK